MSFEDAASLGVGITTVDQCLFQELGRSTRARDIVH